MPDKQKANALIDQTSPYLLQHAHNPVNWYPWGEQALSLAKLENKPILLSIGYSACHWCHVMAHESFEDDACAALMNSEFINIKVDREERPDLDRIYQSAQQLLTRHGGGWPLTMFLHPDDLVPFFGGTYFPPSSRYGMPGFRDLLLHITRYYKQEQDSIRQQNRSLMLAMEQSQALPAAEAETTLDKLPVNAFTEELTQHFDREYGGFGGAPKFPHATNLETLLHHCAANTGADNHPAPGLHMAVFTLEKMALGGIYDQLGGGFCRYAVDDKWLIPHFEKMLYDNGLLIALYAQAWKLQHNQLYKKVALETADWVMRDMQSPEGGYYSSLDADAEGEEGRFYVWTRAQVKTLLTAGEYAIFAARFGLDQRANFEGQWHLYVNRCVSDIASQHALPEAEVRDIITAAQEKLLAQRNTRSRPARDGKILTSWNALMIRAMALAANHFNNETLFHSAAMACTFLHENMWQEGRLLATYKDGRAHLDAYLDDYAYLLNAILEMLSYRWSDDHLTFALQLADALLEHFYDAENGGFFFTSHTHETLIQRRKEFMDDAIPAGNGIAALALCKLGHLLGKREYLDAAEHTLRTAWPGIRQMPSAHGALLLALLELCDPAPQLIIRGEANAIGRWQTKAREQASFRTRIFTIPNTDVTLPGSLGQRPAAGPVTACLCRGFQCLAPVTRLDKLAVP